MMDMELLSQGKFTTSGSSVLKMMQNNSMPALDLIIRESVQNSLDAAISDHKPVMMNFTHNTFDVDRLAECFPAIKEQLLKKFGDKDNKFLSIRDQNTVGLTGDLAGEFSPGEKNQNLGKLVFHIMKAQDKEGAGGSWGIGKTVYYRTGEGLTIYYSRIKKENGQYEERLVAALVENEMKSNGILSKCKNNLGVAFFGEEFRPNDIKAITDEYKIHKLLDIFGITPMDGTDTGTEIIIPFVDDEKLLMNNKSDEDDHWWDKNVEDYLRVSLLRWYFPRMARSYPYGATLIACINGDPVMLNDDTPLYKKYTELYNACFSNEFAPWIKKEKITRKSNLHNEILGYFVYGNVTKEELKMIIETLPNPYQYSLFDEENECDKPLIAFVRRPGMVVSYQIDGKGIGSVKCSKKDEYIIGLFVLNSDNEITKPIKLNLDEYVRQSEKADHTSWDDHTIKEGENKVLIVKSIYNGMEKCLSRDYGEHIETTGSSSLSTNLARKFGKLLMPDEGFGKSGSIKTPKKEGGRAGGGLVFKHKKNKVDFIEQKFEGNDFIVTYRVCIQTDFDLLTIKNVVKTINGWLNVPNYEEEIGVYPCNICKAAMRYKLINNKVDVKFVSSTTQTQIDNYNIKPLLSNTGNCYGFEMTKAGNFVPIVFDLRLVLNTKDKLMQIGYDFDFKEASHE